MKAINQLINEIELWNPKDVSYTKLVGGFSNENYLIHDNRTNKKYALKMPQSNGALANRDEEILVAQKSAEIFLSPKVLYITSQNALVTEYIEGESLTPEIVRNSPTLFNRCINLVKEFHSKISLQHNNHAFDFLRMQMGVEEKHMYGDVKRYQAMLNVAIEMEKTIGFNKEDFCACHNDLITANFINDKNDKCWLIDFEWSGNNDRYYDLAKFSLFTEIHEEKVLQAYFDDVTEYQIGKVFLYKMLNNLLVAQWCALQQQVSTLNLNEELYEIGKKHFELFFMNYNSKNYVYYSKVLKNTIS